MNSYETIVGFMNNYKSKGTSFSDGMRVGDFQQITNMDGTSRGTQGIMASSFCIRPYASDVITVETSVPVLVPGDTFNIPIIEPSPGAWAAMGAELVYIGKYLALKLDCARIIQTIATTVSNDTFIKFSGFDDYFQKVTCVLSANLNTVHNFTPRCIRYLTNIEVTENPTIVFTTAITTASGFELPFTDYGCFGPFISTGADPVMQQATAVGTVFQAMLGGALSNDNAQFPPYTPANWKTPLTDKTGTVRPFIRIDNVTWNNNQLISGFMPVFGYGYAPSFPATITALDDHLAPKLLASGGPDIDSNSNVVNFTQSTLRQIIGIEQYSEGWLPWNAG
jgi:hypothetical protein